MLKGYTYEKKIKYLLLHQISILLMVSCFYIYEYMYRKTHYNHEIFFLAFSFMGLVGGIIFLFKATQIEKVIYRKQKTKNLYERFYVELQIVTALFLLGIMGYGLVHIEVSGFTMIGLIIVINCFTYIMDTVFLIAYLGVTHKVLERRIKFESILFLLLGMWRNKKIGTSLNDSSRKAREQEKIKDALKSISMGQLDVTLDMGEFHREELEMASYINRIQEVLKDTINSRIKDERMKADLITNVSHDLKTPLTSIVNYVDLLKREEFENENAKNYIRIIDEKSQRLKHLTEDLVEISKISSGNIHLDIQTIDFLELLYQTAGECNERFEKRDLTVITKLPGIPIQIQADGSQLYRVIENLYTNTAKYALENTTIYVELMPLDKIVVFTIRNIMKKELHLKGENYEELTERFVRGEVSRTTEGSGLGLSIAKSLTTLMGGTFHILVDNDIFTVRITFPLANGS